MEPLNYLEFVLPSATGRLDPDGIAEAAVIKRVRQTLALLAEEMTLCPLAPEERAATGIPMSLEERKIAMAWLRFALSHEELAREAEADPETLQEAIAKDVALAQAEAGADRIAVCTERGTQLLGAALTECDDLVAEDLEARRAAPDASRTEKDLLHIQFASLAEIREQTAGAEKLRKGRRSARKERVAGLQQEKEQAAAQRARALRLTQAAHSGEEIQ